MRHKLSLLILIFSATLFSSISGFSQEQHKIDSLQKVISDIEKKCPKPCSDDTIRIKAYFELVDIFAKTNLDTVLSIELIVQKIAESHLENNPDKVLEYKMKDYLAEALNNIGYVYYTKGNMQLAFEYYDKSLSILKEIDDKHGVASTENNIGMTYLMIGNFPKGLEYLINSASTLEKINDKTVLAATLSNIAAIYYRLGDIPKSLKYFQKSYDIRNESGDKKGMANSYNMLGMINERNGDIDKALVYYFKSYRICEDLGEKIMSADVLNNLAIIYNFQGNIPKSMECFDKCIQIKKEAGDTRGVATIYNNIGTVYDNLGNYNKSLEYHNKSLKIRTEIDDKKGLALSNNNLGSVYQGLNEYKKAINYLYKSLNIYKEMGEKKGIGTSYLNLGELHFLTDSVTKGFESIEKSIEIFKELKDIQLLSTAYIAAGKQKLRKHDIKAAYPYCIEAHKIAKTIKYPLQLKNTSSLMKNLLFVQNNLERADSFAQVIVDIDNKTIISNFTILSELEQEKYFNSISANYMDFNSYALFRQKDNPKIVNQVYNNTLKNKGILLKSSTAMRNAVLSSKDTILIDNYYKWIHLKKQIAKLYNQGKSTKALDEQANELEKELVKSSQLFSDFNNLQDISWKNVQKSLKSNEASIEFIHFEYTKYHKQKFINQKDSILYCALIVTPDCDNPIMVPLFEEKELLTILNSSRGISLINKLYGKISQKSTKLYKLIWKPIEIHLDGVSTVYISPSGLLHKISFLAINKSQNVFLCDNYNINTQSTTAKVFKPENSELGVNITANVFGGIEYSTDSTEKEIWNYLEGTQNESQIINFFLEEKKVKTNYYSETDASEENFKKTSPNSNLIHLATHGFFYPSVGEIKKDTSKLKEISRLGEIDFGEYMFMDNKNPLMRSGLVLAGANDVWKKDYSSDKEDGVLTALEVSSIDLRKTQLVVLSACETGLGEIKGTEGVYGLQRAFKMAGAKFLIMSLWEVPDKETEEFMTTFYSKLLSIKDIKQAFNQTQKEMRKKYDPYYWAAFVLIE